MHWAAPEYAWLLLLAIPAGFLLRRAGALGHRDMLLLTGEDPDLASPSGRPHPWLAAAPPALTFLLIVASLCRPQWGQEMLTRESTGADILVALDVSRSMLADDQAPTRLAAAKRAIRGLLDHLRGDRIGLIAFAGSAFQVCPLTSDYGAFADMLAETGSDTMPLGGTALATPLTEARRVFTGQAGRSKYLLLISDGEDHGSDTVAAAEALRGAGVAIYSVAVGSAAGGLIPLPGGEFLRDRQSAIVRSRMQAASLGAVAVAGGGRQYDLAKDPVALEHIYATEMSAGERRLIQSTRQQPKDRYQFPLTLALLLLLAEPLIAGRGKA